MAALVDEHLDQQLNRSVTVNLGSRIHRSYPRVNHYLTHPLVSDLRDPTPGFRPQGFAASRYQFVETLLRLAEAKYVKTNRAEDLGEARTRKKGPGSRA